ncbi:MAG TPA: hypothetical protein DCQ31_06530 [Bacteroidales bacterium]|nr:hypothetical protein [Bacteroidales bacterium]
MRHLIVFIALLGMPFLAQAQTDMEFGQKEENTFHLGFNLIPTASGSVINYLLVRVDDNKISVVRNLTRENFLGQLNGTIESNANPDKVDLLKAHNITNPNMVDSLWKLRYAEYPFRSAGITKGWSGKPGMPTPEQLQLLKEFGMTNLSDIIYGENALRLLQTMENSAWIEKYKRGY